MTFTLYAALFIEWTGMMHTAYVLQYLVSYIAKKPVETNEPPRTVTQKFFFWARCLWSLGLCVFSVVVSVQALFEGKTTLWTSIPKGVGFGLLVVLLGVVGTLEATQLAVFTVSKLPKSQRGSHPLAMKTCDLLFREKGKNLPAFMIGRQMCVTLCFFLIARATMMDVKTGQGQNLYGVSDSVQTLFNLGSLGTIFTTILGSIVWQLVAGAFPLQFLSNPFVYVMVRFCLILEATGIGAASSFLGLIHKKIAGFQHDEVYIGTPEERAAMDKADLSSAHGDSVAEPHIGTNVLNYPPGSTTLPAEWKDLVTTKSYSERRSEILGNIRELRQQIEKSATKKEKEAFEAALELEVIALEAVNKEQVEDGEETEPDVKEGSIVESA